ncbi:BTB domain-containing protein [Mycena kentingensis (nom. inval.)]|nr:BTB domain-containing protein [Mycena kentingensis (nom. inval.)]
MSVNVDTILQPERVQELWFNDGNIVLQAENMQYKLFHGILALRSEIFRDMLVVGQQAAGEMVDGCPLVHLPDEARELTPFLKAIYIPASFPSFPNPVDTNTVLGCLSLSDKYQVADLRRRALSHVASAMVIHDDDLPVPRSASLWLSKHSPSCTFGYSDQLFRLVRLAHATVETWILPWAFATLSVSLKNDPDAFAKVIADGTLANAGHFLAGRDRLLSAAIRSTSLAFMHPISIEGCTSEVRCLERRLAANSLMFNRMIERDALHGHGSMHFAKSLTDGEVFCEACKTALLKTQKTLLQELLDNIPELFDLPSWTELEAMKMEAIGPNIYC